MVYLGDFSIDYTQSHSSFHRLLTLQGFLNGDEWGGRAGVGWSRRRPPIQLNAPPYLTISTSLRPLRLLAGSLPRPLPSRPGPELRSALAPASRASELPASDLEGTSTSLRLRLAPQTSHNSPFGVDLPNLESESGKGAGSPDGLDGEAKDGPSLGKGEAELVHLHPVLCHVPRQRQPYPQSVTLLGKYEERLLGEATARSLRGRRRMMPT